MIVVEELTARQQEALKRLGTCSGNAYNLRINLATLYALQKRGLVIANHKLGSVASPKTHIEWNLTQAGKRARLALR